MNESSAIERRPGEAVVSLRVICPKCTRYAVFTAADDKSAGAIAQMNGWVLNRNSETICPKCAK